METERDYENSLLAYWAFPGLETSWKKESTSFTLGEDAEMAKNHVDRVTTSWPTRSTKKLSDYLWAAFSRKCE